jgi:hypothetical protein
MFKWKASPSASWHSPKDHASKQEQNPASTSHTEINSFLRFQRRNPASDCTGIAGRPRGGNKAKQNKSNRIRRANAVAKHKQRGGGAWIRARMGSRIPRPTPGGFHEQTTPRRIPTPMRAAADSVGSRALTSSAGRMGGEQTLAPLGLAWLDEPSSATASQPRLACRAVGFGRRCRGGEGRAKGEAEEENSKIVGGGRSASWRAFKKGKQDGRIRGGRGVVQAQARPVH